MDAPPVQYVKTTDGFDIAYSTCGDGDPFVFVPFILNNLTGMWRLPAFRSLFEAIASRFQLIQYDARGMGDSQRDLPDPFAFHSFVGDLEAVVQNERPSKFVLFAYTHACHAAVHYAARHLHQVRAVILANPVDTRTAYGDFPLLDVARTDWETFLRTWTQFSGQPEFLEVTRGSMTQTDFVKVLDASKRSDITEAIRSLIVPTLVITSSSVPNQSMLETARSIAGSIPHARLVTIEGMMGRDFLFSDGIEEPSILRPIDDFVASLPTIEDRATRETYSSAAALSDLSDREVEVLRLLAHGKSNPEIAKDLFISRNTVQNHVSSILIKLNLQNRAQAAVYAQRHGII